MLLEKRVATSPAAGRPAGSLSLVPRPSLQSLSRDTEASPWPREAAPAAGVSAEFPPCLPAVLGRAADLAWLSGPGIGIRSTPSAGPSLAASCLIWGTSVCPAGPILTLLVSVVLVSAAA